MPLLPLALAQLPGAPAPLDARLAQLDGAIATARAAGARLLVFPEAAFPGYTHAPHAWAPSNLSALLSQRAAASGVSLLGGLLSPAPNGRTDGRTACQLGYWPSAPAPPAAAAYTKRFPSPAESRCWIAGHEPGILDTPWGRIGLLLCADALHPDAWAPLAGQVQAVVIAAAWPDYEGRHAPWWVPGLARLYRRSSPFRAAWLGQLAASLRVPVVFANACGPWRGREGFSGESCAYDAEGRVIARAQKQQETLVVSVSLPDPPPEGRVLPLPPRWAAFCRVYRAAAWAQRQRAPTGGA